MLPEFDETYRVLLLSSEVAPFAKTGGLADVAGSLPKALAMLGNDVRVVLPRYRGIQGLRTLGDFPVWVNGRRETAILRQSFIRAHLSNVERTVPVYFIDNYHYFDRDGLYGYADDAERFAFFSRAALEAARFLGFTPSIVHGNDWQTGPALLLLKTAYAKDPVVGRSAGVFTIHNLQYQGNFDRSALGILGVDETHFHPDGVEFYGQVSYMKAGINYADVVNTVSNTYAQEIQTPACGHGMDGVLRRRSRDLFGIVNGLNYHEFNPATDPRIYRQYDADHLDAKAVNKHELQKEMGLPVADVPLAGMVTRLVSQKGLDLLLGVADQLPSLRLQLVVLGTGDPHYEEALRRLQQQLPGQVAVAIGFNTVLAQRIYAGSDLFLMPSQFEPCGLGQLLALRYGTIPVVRATGGLKDTVADYDAALGTGTGFVFQEYTPNALLSTLRRALELYERRDAWNRMVRQAMAADFSWNRSAVEYMGLYAAARAKAGQTGAARAATA